MMPSRNLYHWHNSTTNMKTFLQFIAERELYIAKEGTPKEFHVFKNPTRTELVTAAKESGGIGYRGILVYKTKNLYLWSSEEFHTHMYDMVHKIPDLQDEHIEEWDWKNIATLHPILSLDFSFALHTGDLIADMFTIFSGKNSERQIPND